MLAPTIDEDRFGSILLKKSFGIVEHKFCEPLAELLAASR